MALERFIPKSPDIFIRNSQDFEVAKFGHLNTIVEYINNNTVQPAGLNGYVQFNDNNALGGDAGLFWDNVNKRLGIGTVTPSSTLIVNGVTGITNSLYLGNTDSFLSTNRFQILNAANTAIMVNVDGGGSLSTTGRFQIYNSARTAIAQAMYYDGGTMVFRPMNDGVESTSFRNNAQNLNILNFNGVNGNVDLNFIGVSLGSKLGIRGSGATSATTSLLVQNSGSNTSLRVYDDRIVEVPYRIHTPFIRNENGNLVLYSGNFEVEIQSGNPTSTNGSLRTTGEITTTDSQTKSIININNLVPSTSASFNTLNGFAFTSTITQTTGTIRGLFINPTLNASTDFRAIETVRGNVLLATTSGNVGIGTTNPFALLTVGGQSSFYSVQSAGTGSDFFYSDINPNITAGANNQVVSLMRLRDRGVLNTGGFTGTKRLSLILENGAGGQFPFQLFSESGALRIGFSSVATPTALVEIKGTGSTSATTSLLVQNSASVSSLTITDDRTSTFNGPLLITPSFITGGTTIFIVRTAATGENILEARENSTLRLGASSGNLLFMSSIFTSKQLTNINFDNGGQFLPNNNINQYGWSFNAGFTNVGAGGTSEASMIRTVGNTATSVGNVTLNQFAVKNTINNTAGTTINRGYFYDPTVTSVVNTQNIAFQSTSGSVNINTATPQESAILQADSTTQGFLPPRQTQVQRLAITSPAIGLIVYQTDAPEGLYINKSTGWQFIA